ncbi:MAG: NAD(+)--dinitrogen-reductase ADP-D-ribosyltransferase [Deferribacterales bacterium]|jgi:NAD+--dinitrogen-reductase ADP-D-ribosyltransferase
MSIKKKSINKLKDLKRFYHYTNLINIPTGMFVSNEYNQKVLPITISGVWEYYGEIFKAIKKADNIEEAAYIFTCSMDSLFSLNEKHNGKKMGSYSRLLKGWLFDSNSIEGAVMKGWVESRFGITPFFHKDIIPDMNSEEYYEYMVEKMDHRLNKNLIFHQLDLLYTYTQVILESFYSDKLPKLTLYRGVNDLSEHLVVKELEDKMICIEQNSLVSFTSDRDIASSFGDYILKSNIPYTKIVFFSEILPNVKFAGEKEYLVLGGRYDTEVTYY